MPSAAIYGSRGSNGVILIQTKKGKKGAASVSYKGQIGFSQPERHINMMNVKDLHQAFVPAAWKALKPDR